MDFQAFGLVVFLSHLPNTKIIVVLQAVIIENQEHAINFRNFVCSCEPWQIFLVKNRYKAKI